jgi:hypothetical protein
MGKHQTGYARVERDGYQSPPWLIKALAEHVELRDRYVWEFAANSGRMSQALRDQGAQVFSSDIEPHPGLDAVFDFLSPGFPPGLVRPPDAYITNPPWSKATEIIEAGLESIAKHGGLLALLLPADFDAGVTRSHLFRHPFFLLRVTLLDRPVWFERADGKSAHPKENCCWQVWARPVLRFPGPAIVRHAITRADRISANARSRIPPAEPAGAAHHGRQ